MSGRSGRVVGSPPEIFNDRTDAAANPVAIAPICATDSSARLVLGAWQNEQAALHRLVTRRHIELGSHSGVLVIVRRHGLGQFEHVEHL
jgi:hypothetical protein